MNPRGSSSDPSPDHLLEKIAQASAGAFHAFRMGADGSFSFVYAGPGIEDIYGFPAAKLRADGGLVIRRTHADDRERVEQAMIEAARAGTPWSCEFRYNHPTRGEIWIEGRSIPEHQADGALMWYGVLTDITRRRRAEENAREQAGRTLRESEEGLQLIFGQLAARIWTTDTNLVVTSVKGDKDSASREIREAMVGRHVAEVIADPASAQAAVAGHEKALAGEAAVYDAVVEAFGACRCRVAPFREADGTITGVIGLSIDLADQRMLVAERDRLEKIARTAPGAIHSFHMRPDGACRIVYGSERLAALYGITARALEDDAACVNPQIHPEDLPRVLDSVEKSRRDLTPWHEEYRLRTPDRGEIWVEGHSVPHAEPDGGVLWHGLLTDISERKLAERALIESQAQLRTTFAHLTEGVVVFTVDGAVLNWNPAALRMHGFNGMSDAPGVFAGFGDLFELSTFEGRILPVDTWPLARILRGEQVRDLELRVRHKRQGWEKVFNFGGAIAHDARGRPLLAIVHISDFTRRHAAEDAVHRLNSELEERVATRTAELENANRELEAFSYSVSHDLRSPLRTVDGFAQAMIEDCGDGLSRDGRRYLGIIREGAQRMGTLIDDLLAFSRIGRLSIKRRPLDTRKLVQACLDSLRAEEGERNIEVTIDALPESQADPALLRQVWSNLLSNAFKYTRTRERARIEVGCVRAGGADVFFVRDNGVGFDPSYAHKTFKVFERLHRAEEFEGTGVGLAIVQRIVTRHGGKVWADARPDGGATFSFTLASTESHEPEHPGRNIAG